MPSGLAAGKTIRRSIDRKKEIEVPPAKQTDTVGFLEGHSGGKGPEHPAGKDRKVFPAGCPFT
jgi:hypothetical protein